MAKGRGHNRKKEARRARADRRAAQSRAGVQSGLTITQQASAPPAPRGGLDALRGQVSGAYRAWVADYGRRQAQAMGEQFPDTGGAAGEVFLLAPLTTRTVSGPNGEVVSVQMGLPIISTRAGNVGVAPDRLAVAALRIPEADTSSAMAALGLGQAPDLPQPEPLFAVQLPAESMRGARSADALAWYLARGVEAGDIGADQRAMGEAAGEALALLRPNAAPYGAKPVDRALFDAYEGYGAEADEEVVPLDITAAPARGGLSSLPSGAYLEDNGEPLATLIEDLRDYVIGLWPYDYFKLEELGGDPAATDGPARGETLTRLAALVRRVDEVLAESAENEAAALAAEGRPPAWIAQETAHYRETREELRATRVAQELLPRLGQILFDLEIPPADYAPPGADDDDDEEDDEG